MSIDDTASEKAAPPSLLRADTQPTVQFPDADLNGGTDVDVMLREAEDSAERTRQAIDSMIELYVKLKSAHDRIGNVQPLNDPAARDRKVRPDQHADLAAQDPESWGPVRVRNFDAGGSH